MQKTQSSWLLFNKIAHRYDFLNWLLSFNQDKRWRKKLLPFISGENLDLADIGTGTGDLLFSLTQGLGNRAKSAVGVDMSKAMLDIAKKKKARKNIAISVEFLLGDAMQLPLQTEKFDVVTMAFSIRNVEEPLVALKELHRVLKHQGQVLILEFSLPQNSIVKWVYLFYFRYILPYLGGLISGNVKAYRYLNTTVEAFPYGDAFIQLLNEAGFSKAEAHPLTFGIATIYVGKKSD